jgi:hypothetical protein
MLRHHTLGWIVARKEAFKFLLLDLEHSEGCKDLTGPEWQMLIDIVNPESPEWSKFWATAFAIEVISNWGVAVSIWLHTCRCHHHSSEKEREKCNLKGRCGIELALGAWKDFVTGLSNLKLSRKAVEIFRQLESGYEQKLVESFQQCKQEMALRCHQAWSFWDQLPHNILSLGYHFLSGSSVDENKSRERAIQLLDQYESCSDKANLGVVPWYIFSKHRQHIISWYHGMDMSPDLRSILMGYCTALIVMQRLEGRHHLVNMRVTRGRALLPAGLFADLRRARHSDLHLVEFREALPSLMQRMTELVPDSWQSQRELLRRVYGFGLDELHPDVSAEQALIEQTTNSLMNKPDTGRLVT